jgi:hypothetical protein
VLSFVRQALLAVATAASGQAHADFYVVVQAANSQGALTQKEAVNLFMGRNRSFANGDFALVFDLPRDNAKRAEFYLALTGMSPAQVNSYWARLTFSGQNTPPQAVPDETSMIAVVKRDPTALGWLSKEPVDKQLRVVLVLRDPR